MAGTHMPKSVIELWHVIVSDTGRTKCSVWLLLAAVAALAVVLAPVLIVLFLIGAATVAGLTTMANALRPASSRQSTNGDATRAVLPNRAARVPSLTFLRNALPLWSSTAARG